MALLVGKDHLARGGPLVLAADTAWLRSIAD